MCHAEEPTWEGMIVPPNGVRLQTEEDIARYAREIYLHSGRSHSMPPGNVSGMTKDERKHLVKWYEAAVSGSSQ